MKRFLVGIMGDDKQYIGSYIIGELDKIGELDVQHMINVVSERGVCNSPKGSTIRLIYKIIHGEKRSEVLNEANMKGLYNRVISQYNEG